MEIIPRYSLDSKTFENLAGEDLKLRITKGAGSSTSVCNHLDSLADPDIVLGGSFLNELVCFCFKNILSDW